MKYFKTGITLMLCASLVLTSCGNVSRTAMGVGIGTAAGAAAGAGIGIATGNTALGTAIGAVVGGVAGGLIGRHMDKQRQELEEILPEAASIETVNDGEAIKVTLESGILFATNSTAIGESAKTALRNFAANLNQNPDTDLQIVGHTDITGTVEYNQGLSEKRARSVRDYLMLQNVDGARMTTIGKGIHEPVADNNTIAGRLQNRRVEIFILPNAKMIEEAQKEAAGSR
ncbi:MAG: OmpA family protein [Bacteroidales bacterium]|jgi:outer membrane protein OmpA-like peptidoglycan-associated protein|nr:OmpA family protein [Bacteroidales bacterium]MDD4257346.1 OmpA family protein [Bacteroidales bacterium]MDD4655611.1 OmpA family protein [Bacteroidales bacterium]MDD4828029.1 OmpA family protein [Bacteroidales bacterium]HPS24645.1 OmpA family protein [Bacteroidales bacterium]